MITKLRDAKSCGSGNMEEKVENTCRSRSVNLRSVDVAIPLESKVGEVGIARRDEREPVRERSVDRALDEEPGFLRPA